MEKHITRPLKVLVPLIKGDLEQAEKAGMPYYKAAGEKLIEAKKQLKHGEWGPWLKKNFNRSQQMAREYMTLAKNESAFSFSSIRKAQQHRRQAKPSRPNGRYHQPSTPPPVHIDRSEIAASKALALKMIDAGYKILAQEYHPDKGGSTEVMARLNRIRANLKIIVERTN